MIYIDPPYNTGKEFIYPDNYSETLETYLAYTGQIDDEGRKFSTNTEAEGRYHTKWLRMMYSRLYLARNLLKRDGAIFASIDETEHTRLRMVMDELFGQENFVADMVWAAGRKNDSKLISVSHEYIVCYARDRGYLNEEKILWRQKKKGLKDIYAQYEKLKRQHNDKFAMITKALKRWYRDLPDSHPAKAHRHYSHVDRRGIYFPADISWPGGGGPKYQILHPVTKCPVKVPLRGWMTSDPAKMQQWINDDRVHFGPDETSVPCIKSYLKDNEYQPPYSVFYQDGRAASKRLRSLIGASCFDYPKDERVLQEIVGMMTLGDDICVDCFAGSGTFYHSVMAQNALDKGKRRCVLVQLPEPLDPTNKDQKTAAGLCDKLGKPRIITELTKERLRRTANKIKNETPMCTGDLGFCVFKLDRSNFRLWDGSQPGDGPEKIAEQLELHEQHLDPNATPEDILYELLLKAGFPLTTKVEKVEMAGKEVFSISEGALLICLEDEITTGLIKAMTDADPLQVICLDSGFKNNDQLKVNAAQTFKVRNRGKDKESSIVFRTV